MKSHAVVRRVFSLGVIFVMTVFALAQPRAAQAGAPIIVNTWQDAPLSNNSACSLRMAVIAANENRPVGGCIAGTSGHDLILLPANYVVGGLEKPFLVGGKPEDNTALTGDLDILEPVTISGAGAERTTVAAPDGAAQDRIFHIINLGSGAATLTDMTITRGVSNPQGNYNIDLQNSNGYGGGILSSASTLILRRVVVMGNSAGIGGGGIRNQTTLPGGLAVIRGTIQIYDSIITGNTSTGGRGGGISNDGNLEIYASLISANTGNLGGALDNKPGAGFSALIVNSTITQNIANAPNVGGYGLAINSSGLLVVRNSTIHANQGASQEAIYIEKDQVKFYNTIISGHPSRSNCTVKSGAQAISLGHNIDQDGSCVSGASDLQVDPKLGGLDKWGGKTPVYALQDGSPAIDAGDDASCPPTDQRGMAGLRPGGARCDIGAFEKDPPPPSQLMLPVIRN